MERRRLFQLAGLGGFIALGGGVWLRRASASNHLRKQLIATASPILMNKAEAEFGSIPAKGREQIRQWFHGKCLNVAAFVDEVCSHPFREKLQACSAEDQRNQLLSMAFCGKVATEGEILNRVQMIVEEMGQELDLNWGRCCMTISNQWKLSLSESYQRLEVEEFLDRVQQLVTTHLKCALEEAKASAYPPVGHTLGKVGKSALGMIQLSPIQVLSDPRAQAILLPTFVVLALEHVFQYIAGVLSDPRPDLQSAISGRLSLLGNRVGNEFESELRKRLGALHGWQERSLSGAAEYYADSAAGWF